MMLFNWRQCPFNYSLCLATVNLAFPGMFFFLQIYDLQFVHQVVAQILGDVLVPALPHANTGRWVGHWHRPQRIVIHQTGERGVMETNENLSTFVH